MSSLHRTPVSPPLVGGIVARTLPVAVAVAAYGVSFGVLAVAAGLSPLLATLSSLLVCAGGSQFAFIGVLAAGGSPMTGAVGGLLLNLRFLAFGLAMRQHLPRDASRPRRLADAHLVVDETVALTLAGPDDHRPRRFRVIGVTLVSTWVVTTAIGAYGGSRLGDLDAWGLDVAFPAGFVALLAPWLRTRRGKVAAAVGGLIALALTPLLPPGIPVVVAAAGAALALRVPEPAPAPDTRPTSARPTGTADGADTSADTGPGTGADPGSKEG
ncbi:AzlC family ABC transporter permease [Egicoccus sp. AB-alg2]|uniref:AzlC family ABC transporter permease n=1 Tax=Egicoccus sp. AB-alg2 TaxID=3242693 RepID=UPI00359D981D